MVCLGLCPHSVPLGYARTQALFVLLIGDKEYNEMCTKESNEMLHLLFIMLQMTYDY